MNEHAIEKITAGHLRRDAYLYVRQSTLRQVVENTTSTDRQYGLRQRAVGLGWAIEQVVVIDEDLGRSGATTAGRDGFARLVADVGMGKAGIVIGLEVSRLARNNADWHRLLEICALTETLILDEDGLYDPCGFNDRLLLGLKGQMSEAELHAGASDNPDLLRLIEGVSELSTIGSEKGDDGSATPTGWAPGSLFWFIDTCGAGSTLKDEMAFDLLVCDDMRTEIADFIGVDTVGRRVVAIHGRAFKRAKQLSASALQEVSAQALKNLGFIQPYTNGTPPNLNRWRNAWRSRAGKVNSRVRRGTGTPTQLWNQMRDVLVDPQATREVWLMLGQGPSQSLLRTESRKAQPRAEVIQMLFSLQATWGAVSSVGARLRVLSSP